IPGARRSPGGFRMWGWAAAVSAAEIASVRECPVRGGRRPAYHLGGPNPAAAGCSPYTARRGLVKVFTSVLASERRGHRDRAERRYDTRRTGRLSPPRRRRRRDRGGCRPGRVDDGVPPGEARAGRAAAREDRVPARKGLR